MTIRRVGVVFDDGPSCGPVGRSCLRALAGLVDAARVAPAAGRAEAAAFDLFLRVDGGTGGPLGGHFRPLAWWAVDPRPDPRRCAAGAADLVFTAQRPRDDLLRAAPAAEWLPFACDPAVHRPHPVPKAYDVCFVGGLNPGPRADLVDLLRRRFPAHFVGRCVLDDMARAYSASRAVFNRSERGEVNMRVFEALACGSLLATDAPPGGGVGELFRDGTHLAGYRDAGELVDKLDFYLARPDARSRVEDAGRREALERHTYGHRVRRVLAAAAGLPASAPAARPGGPPPGPPPAGESAAAASDRHALLALVPPTARDVVDVGCGTGRLGEALKALRPTRVVGAERNPVAAAAARGRLDGVVEGDAEVVGWPYPPGAFDAVVVGGLLGRLADPVAFLRRVRRWLRPGGVVVAGFPNARHFAVVRGLLDGDWGPGGGGARPPGLFTRRDAERLLYRGGFEVPALVAEPGPGHAAWAAAGRPGRVAEGGLRVGPLAEAEAEEFYARRWLAAARPRPEPDWGVTSVVLPARGETRDVLRCLDTLLERTDEPVEVILVGAGAGDRFGDRAAGDPRIRVVDGPDGPDGLAPAGIGPGVAAAAGRQILVLDPDAVVTTGWLGRMLRAAYADPAAGLVGPCSNAGTGPQRVGVSHPDDWAGWDGFAWDWGKARAGEAVGADTLDGFCLLVRRDVVDAIGPPPGGGPGAGDYCRRARRAGFRPVVARDAFVRLAAGRSPGPADPDRTSAPPDAAARARDEPGGGPPAPPAAAPPPAAEPLAPAGPGGVALSGCLIVRDNAGVIRACLESLRPWADELVVVDTGSTDDTPRIAAGLGARVFHAPWRDDFSAARNESVRRARGRWVFWMDSDDTIDGPNGRGLRALALGPHPDPVLGYVIRVHCPGPGDGGRDDLTVVDHVKLFRNRPDLRFEGRVHEQVLPAIRRAGGEVGWTDLFVTHSGYDHSPAGQARKRERDLRLLGLELAERPGHPFTLFNLGMTHADAGGFAAAVGYLEAGVRAAGPADSHLRKAYALLAHSLARVGRPGDALAACDRGLALFPGDLELEFRAGVLHLGAGRPAEAAAAFRRVLSSAGPRYFASFDRGIAGFKARHNLAVAAAEMGDLPGAEREWRRVTAEAPGFRPGWRGLGHVLVTQGRLAAAAALARELAADPGLRAERLVLEARVAAAGGDRAAAVGLLEAAGEADPADPEPARERARLCFEAGDDPGAERALRELVALAPDDPAAFHNLGAVLLRAGRGAEGAAAALRKSLALRPGAAGTLRLLREADPGGADPDAGRGSG